MSYPAPDSRIHVVVTEWNSKWILAVDANTNQYIHWLEDDKRWDSQWAHLVGKPELMLLARVGRSDGPRGRKFFVLQADITIAEPEQVTRSPLDLFTATENRLDETLDSIDRHAPKPKRKRSPMGNVTYAPGLTARLWHAADSLGVGLSEASELCITEGRTPEALVASRGK